jgi:hypothetical protein
MYGGITPLFHVIDRRNSFRVSCHVLPITPITPAGILPAMHRSFHTRDPSSSSNPSQPLYFLNVLSLTFRTLLAEIPLSPLCLLLMFASLINLVHCQPTSYNPPPFCFSHLPPYFHLSHPVSFHRLLWLVFGDGRDVLLHEQRVVEINLQFHVSWCVRL